MYEYRQVIMRMRLGQSDRQIAKAGLMGRKKASELRQIALKKGWLNTEKALVDDATLASALGDKSSTQQSTSFVGPYQEEVIGWHQQGIQGTTIHQALIRKHGFEGSYSSVRRFLQGYKEDNPQATVMLEFEPAQAAQVDFGSGPKIVDVTTGEEFSTWVFVMTLAWSRHQYAQIVRDQKVTTWLGCHRRAFEFFGGVPAKVIIDNPKCAITRACYYDPQVQRSYGEFAEGYGFLISPCPPADPKKKGRVESGVKYIKNNFMPLRDFRHLTNANEQLNKWVLGTAGNRIHGTTKQKPLSRFAQVERHLLTSLPDIPPQLTTWANVKLHGNCHVQFEKAFYSAPFRLVHKQLWLRAAEKTVEIYHQHQLVAVHPRLSHPGARSTIDEHLPPEAIAYKMRDPQWCLKQAAQIGSNCLELIETLFQDRVLDNLRAAQGLIALAKRFGSDRLEAACTRALRFESPRYRTVKTILEKGLDQKPQESPRQPLSNVYTGSGRFCQSDQDPLH
jgi:transposase